MEMKQRKKTLEQEVQLLQQEIARIDQMKMKLITEALKKQGQLEMIDSMLSEEGDANSGNTDSS